MICFIQQQNNSKVSEVDHAMMYNTMRKEIKENKSQWADLTTNQGNQT